MRTALIGAVGLAIAASAACYIGAGTGHGTYLPVALFFGPLAAFIGPVAIFLGPILYVGYSVWLARGAACGRLRTYAIGLIAAHYAGAFLAWHRIEGNWYDARKAAVAMPGWTLFVVGLFMAVNALPIGCVFARSRLLPERQ